MYYPPPPKKKTAKIKIMHHLRSSSSRLSLASETCYMFFCLNLMVMKDTICSLVLPSLDFLNSGLPWQYQQLLRLTWNSTNKMNCRLQEGHSRVDITNIIALSIPTLWYFVLNQTFWFYFYVSWQLTMTFCWLFVTY